MEAKIKSIWKDSLKKGTGLLGSDNKLMDGMGYHFMKRRNKEATLPEEFLAAAYSTCFNMTLAMLLTNENYVINELNTDCIITYDADNVTGSDLSVVGNVVNISEEKFHELALVAKTQCPIGKSFIFPTKLNILLK